MIRCVGGYLDNVLVEYQGREIQVMNMDVYRDTCREWSEYPERRDDIGKRLVKHCTYVYRSGVYLHDEDCCPTRQLSDPR